LLGTLLPIFADEKLQRAIHGPSEAKASDGLTGLGAEGEDYMQMGVYPIPLSRGEGALQGDQFM